jgi:hypothetical protein
MVEIGRAENTTGAHVQDHDTAFKSWYLCVWKL